MKLSKTNTPDLGEQWWWGHGDQLAAKTNQPNAHAIDAPTMPPPEMTMSALSGFSHVDAVLRTRCNAGLFLWQHLRNKTESVIAIFDFTSCDAAVI